MVACTRRWVWGLAHHLASRPTHCLLPREGECAANPRATVSSVVYSSTPRFVQATVIATAVQSLRELGSVRVAPLSSSMALWRAWCRQ